jgi:hypothetical protein
VPSACSIYFRLGGHYVRARQASTVRLAGTGFEWYVMLPQPLSILQFPDVTHTFPAECMQLQWRTADWADGICMSEADSSQVVRIALLSLPEEAIRAEPY